MSAMKKLITALALGWALSGNSNATGADFPEEIPFVPTPMEVVDKMLEAIPEPRQALAEHAPRIQTIKINPEFIGMVIGKGGETIRALEADYEVQIDIEEDGTILVYATEGTKGDAAISAIQALTKEPEVGDTYTGKVVKTTQFGAFVELKKGTDGLLHVSNVGPGRVGHIEDVINRGDVLDVIVQEVDKMREQARRFGASRISKMRGHSLPVTNRRLRAAKPRDFGRLMTSVVPTAAELAQANRLTAVRKAVEREYPPPAPAAVNNFLRLNFGAVTGSQVGGVGVIVHAPAHQAAGHELRHAHRAGE